LPRIFAIIQPNGQNKNRAFQFLQSNIQDPAQLFLYISLFSNGNARDTYNYSVRGFNGLFNLKVPILAGEKSLLIQPRIDPSLGEESLI
jgi:hypothetical protein